MTEFFAQEFQVLLHQTVERVYILAWPQLSITEPNEIDIQIGLGVLAHPDCIFILATDKQDNWTPVIRRVERPTTMDWSAYDERMRLWRQGLILDAVDYEVFDATKDVQFRSIVGEEINDILLISIEGGQLNPFGVKIVFPHDYILMTPISDGSTVETAVFNRIGNLNTIGYLGTVDYTSLSTLLKRSR